MDDVKAGDILIHRSQMAEQKPQHMVVEDVAERTIIVSWVTRSGGCERVSFPTSSLLKVVHNGMADAGSDAGVNWQVTCNIASKGDDPVKKGRLKQVFDSLCAVKERAVALQLYDEAAQIREITDRLAKQAQ